MSRRRVHIEDSRLKFSTGRFLSEYRARTNWACPRAPIAGISEQLRDDHLSSSVGGILFRAKKLAKNLQADIPRFCFMPSSLCYRGLAEFLRSPPLAVWPSEAIYNPRHLLPCAQPARYPATPSDLPPFPSFSSALANVNLSALRQGETNRGRLVLLVLRLCR